MKRTMVILMMLVTVGCMVSNGRTNHSEKRMAVVKAGEVFKVIYDGDTPCLVSVSIYDHDGHVLFSEKIESAKFIRPYNFSLLPKGDYKIEVADNSGEYSERINYKDQDWVTHVAKLNTNDKKYLVAIPSQGRSEVAIHIYDNNDQLIYSQVEKFDNDFAKIYHLKDMDDTAVIRLVNQSTGAEKYFNIQ